MAAPVWAQVRVRLESVGDVVVNLVLIALGLNVRLRDALCEDFGVAVLVTHVAAVVALVAVARDQELVAERTEDDLEELALDKLVAVHLVDLALALLDGSLAAEPAERAAVHRPPAEVLLDCGRTRRGVQARVSSEERGRLRLA